jgi:hypothetical protein
VILVAVIVIVVVIVALVLRGSLGKRFCDNFGIPKHWANQSALNRHLERGRVLRLVLGIAGLVIGFTVASNVPVSKGVMLIECGSEQPVARFLGQRPQREILVARQISESPNWRQAKFVNNGFTWTCGATRSQQTLATDESDRRSRRQGVLSPFGFLAGYVLATLITERRAKVLADPGELGAGESFGSSWVGQRWGGMIAPSIAVIALVVGLIIPMRGAGGRSAAPWGFVALAVALVALLFTVVKALRTKVDNAHPGPVTTASLEPRRPFDYLTRMLRVLAIAVPVTILLLLGVSMFTGLDYPVLWTSTKYEAPAIVLLAAILVLAVGITIRRVVLSPKPFSPNEHGAAVLDDARRVEVSQRLVAATTFLILAGLEPVSTLWRHYQYTGPLFGLRGLAMNVALIRWLVGPYVPKLIVQRWLAIVRSPSPTQSPRLSGEPARVDAS